MEIPKFKPLSEGSEKSKNIFKYILGGGLVILMAALGLESTNNDWDLGKLLQGESWKDAKVMRDINGDVTTDKTKGKYTDEYNCADFQHQEQAQRFFVKAGGPNKDVNRLDGDNDSQACEELPSEKTEVSPIQ